MNACARRAHSFARAAHRRAAGRRRRIRPSASRTRSAAPAAMAASLACAKLNVCGPTSVGTPTAIGSIRFCPPSGEQAAGDERHVRRRVVREHLAERIAQHDPHIGGNRAVGTAARKRNPPRVKQRGNRVEALRMPRHDDDERSIAAASPRRGRARRGAALPRHRASTRAPASGRCAPNIFRSSCALLALRGREIATSNFRLPVTTTSRAPRSRKPLRVVVGLRGDSGKRGKAAAATTAPMRR